VVCSGGRTCQAGVCTCPTNTLACGTPPVCVNTTSNPKDCGGCGTACAAGQICSASKCACPGGFESCGGQCTNTLVDPEHCGNCTTVCGATDKCIDKVCRAAGLPRDGGHPGRPDARP
jgi:hypothetical protein